MKKFVILFLAIVFYTGYLIFTQLLFGDNNLISIEGKILHKPTIIITKERQRTIAQLVVLLRKDNRAFIITADITDSPFGPRALDGVILAIERSSSLAISVRKGDLKSNHPKVYLIKADEKEVFNIIKKPANNGSLYLYLLLLLLLFCSAYYWLQCLQVPITKSTCKRWTCKTYLTTRRRSLGY